MERRRATWQVGNADDGSVPRAVRLWQQAVHVPGIYDLEVDTSVLSPEACAGAIQSRLKDGPAPTAFPRLAAMVTDGGKPLRTPRAKFCAACGEHVKGERGDVADR